MKRSFAQIQLAIFAPLAALLLSTGASGAAPLCRQALEPAHFVKVQQSSDDLVFPESIPDPISSVRALDSFHRARTNFEKEFLNGEAFEAALKQVRKGLDSEEKRRTLDFLKHIRKQANILRSHFIMFSEKHSVPDDFEDFAKNLGHLNDQLQFKAKKLAAQSAKSILKKLDVKKIYEELDSFEPASVQSISREISSLISETQRMLQLPVLSVRQFHEIRKNLKFLSTSLQMQSEKDKNSVAARAFEVLFRINEEMGSIRDQALSEEIQSAKRGIQISEDEGTEKIPETIRRAIGTFFQNYVVLEEPASLKKNQLQKDHIRWNAETQNWQILWPGKKHGFQIKSAASEPEALEIAQNIDRPLDLDQVREKAVSWLVKVDRKLQPLLRNLKGWPSQVHISSRIKEKDSIREKLFDKVTDKGSSFEVLDLTDLAGLRIAVQDSKAVRSLSERIRQELKDFIVEDHERDYETGYQATHLVVQRKDALQCEIQIMSLRMEAWSNWQHGLLYKDRRHLNPVQSESLQAYARKIALYFQAMDEGKNPGPAPSAKAFGVSNKDEFPGFP